MSNMSRYQAQQPLGLQHYRTSGAKDKKKRKTRTLQDIGNDYAKYVKKKVSDIAVSKIPGKSVGHKLLSAVGSRLKKVLKSKW